MAVCSEKRKARRSRLAANMYYCFFDSDRFHGCTLINSSSGGVCFQTGYAIRPGAEIMVFLEDPVSAEISLQTVKGIRAKVRWCQTLPETRAFFYNIGVAYE